MNKSWEKIQITTDTNEMKEAVAPFIISASRATDIPAFYGKWLLERIKRGYLTWNNPFNQMKQYVALQNVRLFVFWTKNPKPFMKYLKELDEMRINYYFQYTLNDYDDEYFEPNVATIEQRIEIFKNLSAQIGKEKVIWRFDPLMITNKISTEKLLEKLEKVGNSIYQYTNKLVFSFADIGIYKKVSSNLRKKNIEFIEFDKEKMEKVAQGLFNFNKNWGLKLTTCCEEIDLTKFEMEHNKCIDDELMIKLFHTDKTLMNFLGYDESLQIKLFDESITKGPNLKDKGQRKICGCIVSKDIGEYDTCNHLCVYCYANSSIETVKKNITKHHFTNEGIL